VKGRRWCEETGEASVTGQVVRGTSASTWPSTEHKVGRRPEGLDEAAEQPQSFGATDLVGGSPGEVDERNGGEGHLHGAPSNDQPLLGAR
jgi:hypothetical protein